MRIIFYGTPAFAVASLQKMIENGFNVVAVVTAPDKPAGRGMNLQASAVKQFAVEHQLPVLQPTNLKSPEFHADLEALKPDLQVIIAFRMLPESVWNFPPMGTLNLHASLLPDYRGAAPINRAIMNGERITGVTTFFLKHEVDTGDLLLQKAVEIGETEDAGSLHDRLMEIGADLVVETLKGVESKTIQPKPQQILDIHHPAPKIFTQDCEIHWSDIGNRIFNQIRGLSPYPGAFTKFKDKTLKIYSGHFETSETQVNAGTFEWVAGKYFRIATIDGWYYAEIVQPEGKRRMPILDFINGLGNS